MGKKNSAEKLRFAYEIEALGTNTLAEVADTIPCIANIALYKEVENTKVDLGPFMNAKEHYPSQSIFIDGVFYNDYRSPNVIDYSHDIIEWANTKNIGKFRDEIMEEAIASTSLLFSDARLIQQSDCLYSKKYPRIVSLSRPSNVLCFICGVMHSQWIIVKCEKFPQEKVFLCTECCNSYLYIDGEKVTEFNLYPYYDQELLTRHLSEANIVE
ncbi:hypothetical protein NQ314_005579 [Rhamnusium bicolor]|uniref:snRNA-activating protein complex subunit 3 n=1 Tax=Rhamnusium bicolor TaxID=1586634 RepID=A0AAV8ZIR9_9CUCU|nr:hypothetical protein NQ314_005579 [Rhamnusium bicolor]